MTFSPPHATSLKAREAAAKAKKAKKKAVAAKPKRGLFSILLSGEATTEEILDDKSEKARMQKLLRRIYIQVVAIVVLTFTLLGGTPFFQTIFQYYAIDSSRHIVRLVSLNMPNMTNSAVLSWATNSITEIMTFGFGDYRGHLRTQQVRFTPEGWRGFVRAFDRMDIGELFRERQLVLTTVPSDTAVIRRQGPNADHIYEWEVQMPIIMTYATNNNVTSKQRAIVTLTISRVSSQESPGQSPYSPGVKAARPTDTPGVERF